MRRSIVLLVATGLAVAFSPQAMPGAGGLTTSRVARSPITTTHRLVLTANLGAPPNAWANVAFLPFGITDDELGFVPVSHQNSLAIGPTSCCVSRDGSVWIADQVNSRVAHYSATGRYLGSVGTFGVSKWVMWDLVCQQRRLFLSFWHSWKSAGRVVVIDGHHQREPTAITLRGDPAIVSQLLAGARRTVALIHGYADAAGHEPTTGPWGWAQIDPPKDGAVRMLPGIPLPDGTSATFTEMPEVASFTTATGKTTVEIRPKIVFEAGAAPVKGHAGFEVVAVTSDALVLRAMVWAYQTPTKVFGGDWVLVLRDDGTVLRWERVPSSTVAIEMQKRTLTVGEDGEIYAMALQPEGASIYRLTRTGRPSTSP